MAKEQNLFPVSADAAVSAVEAYKVGQATTYQGLREAIDSGARSHMPIVNPLTRLTVEFNEADYEEGFTLFHETAKQHAADISVSLPRLRRSDSSELVYMDAERASDDPQLVADARAFILETAAKGRKLPRSQRDARAADLIYGAESLIFNSDAKRRAELVRNFDSAAKKGRIQRARAFSNDEGTFLTVAATTIWTDLRPQFLMSRIAGAADAKGVIQAAQRRTRR